MHRYFTATFFAGARRPRAGPFCHFSGFLYRPVARAALMAASTSVPVYCCLLLPVVFSILFSAGLPLRPDSSLRAQHHSHMVIVDTSINSTDESNIGRASEFPAHA